MTRFSFRTLSFAVLLVAVGGVYSRDLGRQYLSIEEVTQAQEALALSRTGRGLGGDRLPLYFADASSEAGRLPVPIYLEAGLLRLSPFSESLIRIPTVLIGMLDIVLMFILGRRIFANDSLALLAAGLLATAPAHFFHSRLAHQQIYLVPIVLAWLLCVATYFESGRSGSLFAGTLWLGFGMYCYLAALILMPVYFLITVGVVLLHHHSTDRAATQEGSTRWRDLSMTCGGFGLALLPPALWHVMHPERLRQLGEYYTHNGYNQDLMINDLAGTAIRRLGLWWNAFNPNQVFFFGDADSRFSTGSVGYLLLPTGILAAVGLFHLRRLVKPEVRLLCAAGVLCAPLPAVVVGSLEIKRWLPVLPFIALAAAWGVGVAFDSRRVAWRVATAALVMMGLVQFGLFVHDYLGDYRARSAVYYGGNLREAVRETLTTASDPTCIFLDDSALYISANWELYTRTLGQDSFAHAQMVDYKANGWAPPPHCREATVVAGAGTDRLTKILDENNWMRTVIPETDRKVILIVFRHRVD